MTMKVTVIGANGYVGRAITKLFEGFHEVTKVDPTLNLTTIPDDTELAVICVPTPVAKDNSCDTSIVEHVIKQDLKDYQGIILIKSTVEPGTTDRLILETGKRIVFSPEFVGESKYGDGEFNFGSKLQLQKYFIFGGETKDTSEMAEIYSEMCGPDRTYRQTSALSAELVKYMENSYFSTKLIYCYEIDQICKRLGIHYTKVREMMILDPRINKWHTTVFRSNKEPFGGKCLPKDTMAIIEAGKKMDTIQNCLNKLS